MKTALSSDPLPPTSQAAILVAHPDDELLWAGGFLIQHFDWDWFIGTLCRASDPDRAPKFFRLLECLGARGAMADMDDGPEQQPLPPCEVQRELLELLPETRFAVLLTHGPQGEYTWHRRHMEVCQAVGALWRENKISIGALWLFAYTDDGGRALPQAVQAAHRYQMLSPPLWQAKYNLLTQIYGFQPTSWEARATPRAEAFWVFNSANQLDAWLNLGGG